MSTKRKAHTVTAPSGEKLVLIAPTAKLVPFFGTLTADADVTPSYTTVPRKAYSRKQYPGDTTRISVPAGTTRVYNGKAIALSTLPGKNAYLETIDNSGTKPKTKVLTVTFVGAIGDLHQWCLANAEIDFVLRSPGGKPLDVKAIA